MKCEWMEMLLEIEDWALLDELAKEYESVICFHRICAQELRNQFHTQIKKQSSNTTDKPNDWKLRKKTHNESLEYIKGIVKKEILEKRNIYAVPTLYKIYIDHFLASVQENGFSKDIEPYQSRAMLNNSRAIFNDQIEIVVKNYKTYMTR